MSVRTTNTGGFGASPLETRLTRTAFNQTFSATAAQSQVDGALTHLLSQSGQLVGTFLPLVAGGTAARLARTGVLAIGAHAGGWVGRLVKGAAELGSLGAEVVGFETAHRSIIGLRGPIRPMNLWRWSGEGGLKQGFFGSAITFGTLRGGGRLAQGQNMVVQHVIQSTAMVAGHNLAGVLNILPRPVTELASQFFEAETTNVHLGSVMAALHHAAPGLHGFERGMDLALQARNVLFGSWEGNRANEVHRPLRSLRPDLPPHLRRTGTVAALIGALTVLDSTAADAALRTNTTESTKPASSRENRSWRGWWLSGLAGLMVVRGRRKRGASEPEQVPLAPESIRSLPVRDYQNEAIGGAERFFGAGNDRALIVLPTGTGKTTTFSEAIGRFLRNPGGRPQRVLVLTHRQEILGQNAPSEVGIMTEHLNREGIRALGITEEAVWRRRPDGTTERINGSQAAQARREGIEISISQ